MVLKEHSQDSFERYLRPPMMSYRNQSERAQVTVAVAAMDRYHLSQLVSELPLRLRVVLC